MVKQLAKQWACVFAARSGHARALFATKDLAKQFAERHARAFVAAGTSLTWLDSADSSTLRTKIGKYVVTTADDPRVPEPRETLGEQVHRNPRQKKLSRL